MEVVVFEYVVEKSLAMMILIIQGLVVMELVVAECVVEKSLVMVILII